MKEIEKLNTTQFRGKYVFVLTKPCNGDARVVELNNGYDSDGYEFMFYPRRICDTCHDYEERYYIINEKEAEQFKMKGFYGIP